MRKIDALRAVRTKPELARLLGIRAAYLTYVLYVLKPSTQYRTFTIPKKSGGDRTIHSPSDRLKLLQSLLSKFLLDCIDEINYSKPGSPRKGLFVKTKKEKEKEKKKKKPLEYVFTPTLSHGFVRNRSIITNAMMHLHKKNVLNVDLKDFFDSFNFGRVRGFFITNRHFRVDPHIATVIAQIACYENKLPQGSPCSPVITNLITHVLDVRLAQLARDNSCTYSRYADDITFSTRKELFPQQIMIENQGSYTNGLDLLREVTKAGFELNPKKTRIQYNCSRQDVTGLVVNKKPNVKCEYWRTVRSQCHLLFKSGAFTKKINGEVFEGNINELEGQLNFIDQVDYYNRLRQKPALHPEYARFDHKKNTRALLSGRETVFSKFLFYRAFYANEKPMILCEGKTDNVYIKSAINILSVGYPKLAKPKTLTSEYQLLVSLFNYTERTKFLLQLAGGSSYLKAFIENYDKLCNFYAAPKPNNPVIVVLDNDKGFGEIDGFLKGKKTALPVGGAVGNDKFRTSSFIHVTRNLYIVLTPRGAAGEDSAIENLFSQATLNEKVADKKFNPADKIDSSKEYGKEVFAKKVVSAKKNSIDFSGFNILLARIVKCIGHYETIK